MALVSIISFSVKDYVGGVKAIQIYVPVATTLTEAQTFVTSAAVSLDDMIDGFIEKASVTLALTLPGGIKTSANVGNLVNEGALLDWDAAGTDYAFSHFLPSMQNTLFVGDVWDAGNVDAGEWQTDMIAGGVGFPNPTDKYGNDITAFIAGVRKFRK